MSFERAMTTTVTSSDLQRNADVPLYGRWLVVARTGWLVMTVLTLGLFIAAIPARWTQLSNPAPNVQASLMELGLSIHFYATYNLTLEVVAALSCVVIGVVIFWRKSDERMALFVSLMLVMWGTLDDITLGPLLEQHAAWSTFVAFFSSLSFLSFLTFFYLFPNGRFVPRWTRVLVVAWFILESAYLFLPNSPFNSQTWSPVLFASSLMLVWGTCIFAQIYRYMRVSSPMERQQTKWLIFGFTAAVLVGLPFSLLDDFIPTLAQTSLLYTLADATVTRFTFLLIPLSIGIAVLRYRLWDIDPIINRTLVYGALTASIIAIYALVVGYFSTFFQVRDNLIISLVATGIVAMLFQPLRARLQHGVNRLMYGERDEPYAVISRLGQRLEATLVPDAVLPTIVETVKEALKLPYAAIMLQQGDELVLAAASGTSPNQMTRWHGDKMREDMIPPLAPAHLVTQSPAHLVTLPLIYQNETVGQLVLAPRAPGETFTPADRRLLDDLARQAGVAAHAVRLHTQAVQLAEDLQRSRERLVTAREEERWRLRRDLHDGLGPRLASQTMKLEAARDLLAVDPARADALLDDLIEQSQTAIADIRRLVYALRPPALDELGLVSAIREQAAQYQGEHTGSPLRVVVDAPEQLLPLPAAVEVAAYRISQEALTNVVRHAGAQQCVIRLRLDDAALSLEIEDDGTGLPVERHAGVGLNSMRERAEELGGTCVIESVAMGGTTVRARLPLHF